MWEEIIKLATEITDNTHVIEQIKRDIEKYRTNMKDHISKAPSSVEAVDQFLTYYSIGLMAFCFGCYDEYASIFDEWISRARFLKYDIERKQIEEG